MCSSDLYSNPSHGVVTWTGSQFIYQPHKDFNGSDAFTYLLSDGDGGTANGLVNLVISPMPDTPVAYDDVFEFKQGEVALLNVLNNDTDADAGDTLNVISYSQPVHGSLTMHNGSLLYISNSTSPASFNYSIEDSTGLTSSAFVQLRYADAIDESTNSGNNGGSHMNIKIGRAHV